MRAIGSALLLALASACSSGHGATSTSSANGLGPAPISNFQSPVPPDGPCTVAAGAVTTIFNDDVENFSVDDQYAYVAGIEGVMQVPLAGGAGVQLQTTIEGMAIGSNALFLASKTNPPTLTTIAIADAPTTPTYGSGLPFDGENVYVSFNAGAGQPALAQMPVAGGAPIISDLPIHTVVNGLAMSLTSIFVAGYTLPDSGDGSPYGGIYSVPIGGGNFATLASNLRNVNSIAADDSYIYFSATNGADGGVGRMNFDGTNVITLLASTARAVAVDSHALYVLTDTTIEKIDTTSLAQSTLVSLSETIGIWNGLVLHDGNLYASAEGGGALSGPQLPGGLVTLCK